MRLHLLSDLHIDCHGQRQVLALGDITLLAGDIADGADLVRRGYCRIRGSGRVFAVAGNHEWHGLDIGTDWPRLRRLAAERGVHLLNRAKVGLGQGWTLLACSLWTDFSLNGNPNRAGRDAGALLDDFSRIRLHGRALRPGDVRAMSLQDRDWLDAALARVDPERCVVMTHFGPLPASRHPRLSQRWQGRLDPYFANDLSEIVARHQPALWVHGHTHVPLSYRMGATHIVCNPRGNKRLPVTGYQPALVLPLAA